MKPRYKALVCIAVAAILQSSYPYAYAADSGERLYRRCKTCHALSSDDRAPRMGPHLECIFGRPAGSLDDFRYSPAMRDSGIVWDEEILTKFVQKPREVVPKTRMVPPGFRNEEQVAELLDYLRHATMGDTCMEPQDDE